MKCIADACHGKHQSALEICGHIAPPDERQALREDVAAMRALGVAEWKDIVLFPERQATTEDFRELTPEEQASILKEKKAQYEALLYASST